MATDENLQLVLIAVERNYARSRNVVGLGIGQKLKDGRPTEETQVVQFYVKKKLLPDQLRRKPLPSFVYGRSADGSVAFDKKFVTDVIEVGNITPACGSGSEVDVGGHSGTITLVFKNKADSDSESYYLLTCSHVVSDLEDPILGDELTSPCCPDCQPLAKLTAATSQDGNNLQFDIAVARLEDRTPPHSELTVIDEPEVALRDFMATSEITAGLDVQCALSASLTLEGEVRSTGGLAQMDMRDGRTVSVQNALLLEAAVEDGDSGGLIYRDDLAVGILFAKSDSKFAWFHPLIDAVSHLNAHYSANLRCFT